MSKVEAMEDMIYLEDAILLANLMNMMSLVRLHIEHRKAIEGSEDYTRREGLGDQIMKAIDEYSRKEDVREDDLVLAFCDVMIPALTEIASRRLQIMPNIGVLRVERENRDDMTDYIG